MRRIDCIRQMSLEELAPYFVYRKIVHCFEDELIFYVSPSKKQFVSREGAIDDCIKWLDSEAI